MGAFTPPGFAPKPLSKHALGVFTSLEKFDRPTQEINPGVVHQLMQTGLVEIIDLPSPYRSHKPGTRIPHLRLIRGRTHV